MSAGAMARIVPIAEEHIDGFRAAVDSVAREGGFSLFSRHPPRLT